MKDRSHGHACWELVKAERAVVVSTMRFVDKIERSAAWDVLGAWDGLIGSRLRIAVLRLRAARKALK